MSTEEKASKKAKTVDNESGASKYSTGTSVREAHVDCLPRVAAVRRVPYMKSKMYYIDDNGNAMFQSYLSYLFKKETG